jgi:hypothetical protein
MKLASEGVFVPLGGILERLCGGIATSGIRGQGSEKQGLGNRKAGVRLGAGGDAWSRALELG